MSFHYIDSSESLHNVLPRLSACQEIGLDLEFDRNSYGYGFVLCLIQISTKSEIFLIDPFGVNELNGLWKIFEDDGIVKVIHNASEDLILLKINNCEPKNIWDTEKASMILNHEKTGLSSLLEEYFQEQHSKKAQRTNWRNRPLTEEQLKYAMEDVRLLLPLKKKLEEGLKRAKREHWIIEEGKQLEELEQKENESPFLKYRDVRKLNFEQKDRLKNFYFIREEWARKMDKPPYQILANDLLVKYSESKITRLMDWVNLKGLNPHFKNEKAFNEYLSSIDVEVNVTINRKARNRTNKDIELEKALKNVRKNIKVDFGEQSAKLIISQSVINDILSGGSLDGIKSYAKKIIFEYADNIGLSLKQ